MRGVTLVEILIVAAIIAITLGGIVTLLDPVSTFQKGRDGIRKKDLIGMQQALELFRGDFGYYPQTISLLNSGSTIYMRDIPNDPVTTADYIYLPLPSNCNNTDPDYCTGYQLTACLDYQGDPGIDQANICATPQVSFSVTNP